jgi:hypothetical protein
MSKKTTPKSKAKKKSPRKKSAVAEKKLELEVEVAKSNNAQGPVGSPPGLPLFSL